MPQAGAGWGDGGPGAFPSGRRDVLTEPRSISREHRSGIRCMTNAQTTLPVSAQLCSLDGPAVSAHAGYPAVHRVRVVPVPFRPMLKQIGIAAREARQDAGISTARIAAEADVSDSSIRRFEAGRTWPKGGPDATIAVYAEQIGMRPIELWRRAVELLERVDP